MDDFTYPNAPISEALIDIRVKGLPEKEIENLRSLHKKVIHEFPIIEDRVEGVVSFKVSSTLEQSSGEAPASKVRTVGFQFKSQNGHEIFQARLNGFTFNMIKPYTNWNDLCTKAKKYWEIYSKCCDPEVKYRVALRYINKIMIPAPVENFRNYIRSMPPIPKNLPPRVNNFFSQVQVPGNSDGESVILTQTIEPSKNGKIPYLLDIDVFRMSQNFVEEDIWTNFDELRVIKNETFESCITDRTRALFS